MEIPRQYYTEEFKQEAVKLIRESGLTQKKQLTADERRYTQINQKLEAIIGLTKKVNLILSKNFGLICVHPLLSAVKCRL